MTIEDALQVSTNRQLTGRLGEFLALEAIKARVSCNPNLHVKLNGYLKGSDILILNRVTGEIDKRVEVKTAKPNKRGGLQFNLYKKGHTDVNKSEVLILIGVMADNLIFWVIPVELVKDRKQITIANPLTGKYSQYVSNWQLV